MASRVPLVLAAGGLSEIPAGDTLTINATGLTPVGLAESNVPLSRIMSAVGDNASPRNFQSDSYGKNNGGFSGFACEGTPDVPLPTASGRILQQVRAWGYDGATAALISGGRLRWEARTVGATWAAGDHGSIPVLTGCLKGAAADFVLLDFDETTGFAKLAAGSTVGGQAIVTTNDPRLSDVRTPENHAASHGAGGIDAVTVSTGQVSGLSTLLAGKVDTTDPRLSDARTPTAHAASHGSAGGDALTLAQSQVTNLTADLAAKMANPMTALGDIIYGGASGVPTRLGGSTLSSSNRYLRSLASAGVPQAPLWGAIQAADVNGSLYWARIMSTALLSITGATTATINRLHVVSGTSADYTITMPATPSAGDVVGFYVKDYSAASKQFTLDAGGTVKIAGRTRYLVLLHTNTALLYFDGTDWQPLVLNLDTPWVTVSNYFVSGTTFKAVTTAPTLGSSLTENSCRWRRIGDSLHVIFRYHQTAVGTAGSGNYLLVPPIGQIAAPAYTGADLPTLTQYFLGTGRIRNGTPNFGMANLVPYDGTNFRVFAGVEGAADVIWGSTNYPLSGTGTLAMHAEAVVPMTDW